MTADLKQAHLVKHFDHYGDLASAEDPFEAIEALRGERAVWSPEHGGFWILTGVQDQRDLLHRTDAFTTTVSGIPPYILGDNPLIPMNVDAPDHAKYRAILGPMFSPKAVEEWAAETRSTCVTLINGLAGKGKCEVMWEFARLVPLAVFQLFMGIEADQARKWTDWHWDVQNAITTNPEAQAAVMQRVLDTLRELITTRAASIDRGDDIPRRLLRSTIDERLLTEDEVLQICWNLFIASLDTTASAMVYFLYFLATHSEARNELASDLSLVPRALEELLRLNSFVISNRTATRDVDIAGVHMRAGDQVMLPTSLASRDPSEFSCPAEFQMRRLPNHHFAFGGGPHRCLGSHLARMELRIALEEWHRLIPDYHLATSSAPARRGGHLFSPEELHLEWAIRSGEAA